MSYINGSVSLNLFLVKKVKQNINTNTLEFSSDKLSVKGSGLPETFFYDISEEKNWSWVVCGIGIIECSRIVTKAEWRKIITQDDIKLKELDGHWIILRWKGEIIEFYNDPLELRKLYWKQESDRIIFSTNLADLSDMIKNPEFSFQNYAGYFRYVNSFGNRALLKDVNRLGVGGYLKINNDKIYHKTSAWEIENYEKEGFFIEKLKSIININFPNRKKPVLLLSGGMDSRTVLALLKEVPDLLTLGINKNSDVILAKQIGEILNKKTQHYEYKIPSTLEEKEIVFNKMKKVVLLEFPGLLNSFDVIKEKNKEGCWVIDGGRGEVIRHGSTRRILFFGQKFLRQGDFVSLGKLLETKMYPYFSKELEMSLLRWAEQEFIEAIETMPKSLSINDWITLLQIRYRVKNSPLNGQGAYDNLIPSFMPLIQPSIIRAVQSYPTKIRINNRLNNQIINNFLPLLKSIHISRHDTIIPYFLHNSVILPKVCSYVYHTFNKQNLNFSDLLMYSLKDFVLERIKSNDVRDCGWYDMNTMINISEQFFENKIGNSLFLYKWLEVDFWREKIQSKKYLADVP
ncbi:MAG: hypothetical protein FWG98_06385 [Candidatus Cloacimonetes bacterium]|nr:hypothetical protein [Candidatus Cloacimonadota bacterium]